MLARPTLAALLASTGLFASLLTTVATPASANDWPPPAPTVNDACGTKQDKFYVPGNVEGHRVAWYRGNSDDGEYLFSDSWATTNGASSVTVVAKDYNASGREQAYTLTFNVGPNSACVEAPDTVEAQIGRCNPETGSTAVKFTVTNVDDSTDWSQRYAYLTVERVDGEWWDIELWATGQDTLPDGGSLSVESGDYFPDYMSEVPRLWPGTHSVSLDVDVGDRYETRELAERFYVPECGRYPVPYGDPVVGFPKARVSDCRQGRVVVKLDSREAVRDVRYKVGFFRAGRYRSLVETVPAGAVERLVLRRQRSGKSVSVAPQLAEGSVPGPGGWFLVHRQLRC